MQTVEEKVIVRNRHRERDPRRNNKKPQAIPLRSSTGKSPHAQHCRRLCAWRSATSRLLHFSLSDVLLPSSGPTRQGDLRRNEKDTAGHYLTDEMRKIIGNDLRCRNHQHSPRVSSADGFLALESPVPTARCDRNSRDGDDFSHNMVTVIAVKCASLIPELHRRRVRHLRRLRVTA